MTTEDFLRFLNEETWPPAVGSIIFGVTGALEADREDMAWAILWNASKIARELNSLDVNRILYAAAMSILLKFVDQEKPLANQEKLIAQITKFNHFMEVNYERNYDNRRRELL